MASCTIFQSDAVLKLSALLVETRKPRDMAVPLGHNNPPPEQLFRQGAESRWMPEPDVMELPDATALYPI
eukprot:1143363-Pelagomonas_calceolata.AAC.9